MIYAAVVVAVAVAGNFLETVNDGSLHECKITLIHKNGTE